jgi:hypothetical protein
MSAAFRNGMSGKFARNWRLVTMRNRRNNSGTVPEQKAEQRPRIMAEQLCMCSAPCSACNSRNYHDLRQNGTAEQYITRTPPHPPVCAQAKKPGALGGTVCARYTCSVFRSAIGTSGPETFRRRAEPATLLSTVCFKSPEFLLGAVSLYAVMCYVIAKTV